MFFVVEARPKQGSFVFVIVVVVVVVLLLLLFSFLVNKAAVCSEVVAKIECWPISRFILSHFIYTTNPQKIPDGDKNNKTIISFGVTLDLHHTDGAHWC